MQTGQMRAAVGKLRTEGFTDEAVISLFVGLIDKIDRLEQAIIRLTPRAAEDEIHLTLGRNYNG